VPKQNFAPVIRVAPLGELKVYAITEAELDQLEHGSPSSIYLNFALFFWGVCLSLFAALLTATGLSNRAFVVFVVFFAVTLVAAAVFSVLWAIHHRSSGNLANRIRGRMPPLAIQETAGALPPPDSH
jgi:glucan phosphoethanolaminetransferase (alkaline phosphatase superfamily)